MKDLTDEQLNEAVWEFRGWNHDGDYWQNVEGIWTTRDRFPSHIEGIEALGHVHEAEKKLISQGFFGRYCAELEEVCEDELSAHVADARQRVIALLRVVRPELFQ